MKKEMTSVDIAAVVSELSELEGAKFDKFYQYEDGKVRVKIRDYDRGRLDLIIETGDWKRIHLTQNPEEAPQRPPNLPMLMRKRLSGGEIASVDQYDFDRIVEIRGEREDEYSMVAELFGDGNFVFTESDGTVLRSTETVRLKTRTVAPGEEYVFPQSRLNPLELTYDGFVETMEDSDTDFVRTLASQLNFGGLYAEEICARAGIEKEKAISDADEDDYEALFEAMEDIFSPLRDTDGGVGAEDLDPQIVYDGDGDPVDVVPFSLKKYEDDQKEKYESFNDALDAYFDEAKEKEEEESEEAESALEEEIQKYGHIIRQQEEAVEEFEEEEEELKQKAERLYAKYDVVDELLSNVREARSSGQTWDGIEETLEEASQKGIESAEIVESVRGQDGVIEIDLGEGTVEIDVGEGIEENASRLYDEAKNLREKREGAIEALENSRQELEELKKRKEEEETEEDEEEDKTVVKPRGEMWYDRFRWFRTSDGFLVIGGRNADQNEEIYKKYTESNDLFFHTQAHGAPITILKATEPNEPKKDVDFPESSKRQAAIFAASYSSVWDAGHGTADVYSATPDQLSKTPESGEYIEKGSVVVRGDREYYTVPLSVGVGLRLDEKAGVIGGPPEAIEDRSKYYVELEPGMYSQNDTAKKIYRRFREEAEGRDEKLVRKMASPDKIQKFLPTGGSRLKE
ncbi:ribosome rescue protein RqcH [Halorutilales archaeon Cl-col2-1]